MIADQLNSLWDWMSMYPWRALVLTFWLSLVFSR